MEKSMHDQSQGIVQIIIEVEEKNFRQLNLTLSDYIKKQSYEYSDIDRKSMEAVPLRSVQKITGRRGMKPNNVLMGVSENVQPNNPW
ncbi:hypothetical protein KEJ45_00235 [Candidatus Bathyarchaeota archaeon]|nr:hypothetical protein [Candidatus Bathyarchaeota archaeon]